jgi:hypothetical protein
VLPLALPSILRKHIRNVQRVLQLHGCVHVQLDTDGIGLTAEQIELAPFRRRLLTPHRARREVTNNLLGDGDVGQQHEVLHEGVRVTQRVDLHVQGALRLRVQHEAHFRGSQRQGSRLDTLGAPPSSDHVQRLDATSQQLSAFKRLVALLLLRLRVLTVRCSNMSVANLYKSLSIPKACLSGVG